MSVAASALDNLHAKTPDTEVKWLPASAKKPALAYVDARYVMRLLDSVLVGPANWQCDYRLTEDGKVACGIGILVDFEDGSTPQWVWKWDGAGETDIEGEKGSFSDAFKRAAVKWGIARDLYDSAPRQQLSPPAATANQPPAGPARPAGGSTDLTEGLDDDLGKCPWHKFAWKNGNYGWYCSGKKEAGGPMNKNGYCAEKPTQEWVDAQG